MHSTHESGRPRAVAAIWATSRSDNALATLGIFPPRDALMGWILTRLTISASPFWGISLRDSLYQLRDLGPLKPASKRSSGQRFLERGADQPGELAGDVRRAPPLVRRQLVVLTDESSRRSPPAKRG